MLLGCSREFWEGKVLKEKGNVCPGMRIFSQPRAVCNKGAVSRVKFGGGGIGLEEKKKGEGTLERGNVGISMGSSKGIFT